MTPDEAKAILDYDPETGILVWKQRPRSSFKSDRAYSIFMAQRAGKEAGSVHPDGYRRASYRGRKHRTHRLAWMIAHGEIPDEIDHIDGNRLNNRIANLRDVTRAENTRNLSRLKANRSGTPGVRCRVDYDKWVAWIGVDGRQIYLGWFQSMDEAVAARKEAEKKYGFHPNHGRGQK